MVIHCSRLTGPFLNRQVALAHSCLEGRQIPLNGQLSLMQLCTHTHTPSRFVSLMVFIGFVVMMSLPCHGGDMFNPGNVASKLIVKYCTSKKSSKYADHSSVNLEF